MMSLDELSSHEKLEIAKACNVSVNSIEDVYPCTPLQVASMAESSIRTGFAVFQFVLAFSKSIDLDRLCNAIAQVVALNAVFRTRIVDCRAGLVQVVVSDPHQTSRETGDMDEHLQINKTQPMSLGDVLFRSSVVNGNKSILTIHHALMDQTSFSLMTRDIMQVYHGQCPSVGAPFKDFVKHCLGIDEAEAKIFWASQFRGVPTLFPKVEASYLPDASHRQIRHIALSRLKEETISPAHVPSYIEASVALTIASYSGSESIAFGLVLSGRSRTLKGAESTLGPTIATVPVQVHLQRSLTVETILRERNSARRKLQTHTSLQYGLPSIRAVSEAARVASEFQTLLNISPNYKDLDVYNEVTYEYTDEPEGAYALVFNINLEQTGVVVVARSDPKIISEPQLTRILNQFEHLLHTLMEVPSQTKLGQVPILSWQDRDQIMEWNKVLPEVVDECLHVLFSLKAEENSNAVAVEGPEGSMTYKELDQATNRLAHELRRRGISDGDAVAYVFEKSIWTVVALFAIMKAGGICVPIERTDPLPRKEIIISNSEVKMTLASAAEVEASKGLTNHTLEVSQQTISALPNMVEPLDGVNVVPSDLAYIIFTSGSTGVPKGVMLEHRNLASSATALSKKFGWRSGYRVLQFSSNAWDASLFEILGALLFGGTICIPSDEDRQSNLAGFIESSKINWAFLTPTVIRSITPAEIPNLKSLCSGGEALTPDGNKTWGDKLRFLNAWGPCECSIACTVEDLTPDSPYPETIGSGISGVVWIVKPSNVNELAPIGAVGEMVIEGPGVSRGYLNDPVKTKAAFISPPAWAPRKTRFYRTGDLAKYNSDGSLAFVERQDGQVKVRGQRFELGEVEAVLTSCDKVQDAVATTKIVNGRTALIAVVSLTDSRLPQQSLLEDLSKTHPELTSEIVELVHGYVRDRLPTFMVPTIWLAVEKLPRTQAVKLDRVAITEWLKTKKDLTVERVVLQGQPSTLTPPETDQERQLQSCWASVLDIPADSIGRESSFIHLGGDSILAMQVASRCRNMGLRVSVASLLGRSSLTSVAASSEVSGSSSGNESNGVTHRFSSIPKALQDHLNEMSQSNVDLRNENIEHVIPATDLQLGALADGEAAGSAYWLTLKLDFSSHLDANKLQNACEEVFQHHAILRTTFVRHGSTLVQVVLRNIKNRVVIEEEPPAKHTIEFNEGEVLAQFHLIASRDGCKYLLLEIHHALYDALSLNLLLQDLDAAYHGNKLSGGPEFYSWVSYLDSLDLSPAQTFWKDALRGSRMPDLVPPQVGAIRGFAMSTIKHCQVPLAWLEAPFGTPADTFKVAWALVLSLATGQDDVVFAETNANRFSDFPGIENVRGPCINNIPVRVKMDQNLTLSSLICQVRDWSVASLSHSQLSHRSIIKDCTDWSPSSRFTTGIVYQNHGVMAKPFPFGDARASASLSAVMGDTADLWVMATPGEEHLGIKIYSAPEVVPDGHMEWVIKTFLRTLEGVPSYLAKPVSEFKDFIVSDVGSYTLPPLSSQHFTDSYAEADLSVQQEVVEMAWTEVGIDTKGKDEAVPMFECGADSITALVLVQYYQHLGFNITMQDLVHNTSRMAQRSLLTRVQRLKE